jgi:putative ABC transport system ATP-binding protein
MILADEPTGNLDVKTTNEILDLFALLNDHGHTIVVVTHEKDVAACTRRVLRMREGQIMDEVKLAG